MKFLASLVEVPIEDQLNRNVVDVLLHAGRKLCYLSRTVMYVQHTVLSAHNAIVTHRYFS